MPQKAQLHCQRYFFAPTDTREGQRKRNPQKHGWERQTIQHTSEILLGTVPPVENHWIGVAGNRD